MVIYARSSELNPLFNFLLAGLIYLSPAFAVNQKDSISFQFNDIPLRTGLKILIDDYRMVIAFPDNIGDIPLTAECESCSQKDAIISILSRLNLIWKLSGNQYTIFNPTEPFRFSVSGRAMDKTTGEPIPFANVFIPELMVGDISRQDGSFSISNISVKSCTLNISYIGYEIKKTVLLFPKDEKNFMEIFIAPKVLSTETVSITGATREFMDRSNSPGQISFSPRHISTLPNLGEVDIFRSLQMLPGIQLGIGGSSGLYIRGGTPDQNLILLDGMPIYQTDHLFGFVSGVNANSIKDVQVYKGGMPSRYGGRISSVIELTSRNGNSLSPHGSVYGNLMSQGLTGELPILSRGNWIFNIRSSTTSSFQTELYRSIQDYVTGDDNFNLIGESANSEKNQKSIYLPQFSYFDFTNHFSYMATPNHRFTFTNTTGRDSIQENREFYGFSNIWFFDSSYTEGITELKNNGSAFNLSSHWNHESNTQFSFSNYTYESAYDSKSSAEKNTELLSLGSIHEKNSLEDKSLKLHHRYKGSENHIIESGIDETFYHVQFNNRKTDGLDSNESFIEQKGFLHSFYLQDQWTPSRNWTIQTGLRMSYYSERMGFYTSPRISVINKMLSNITLEASMGKQVQFIHQLVGDKTTRGTQGMWVLSTDNIPNTASVNTHFGLNWDFGDYSLNNEFYHRNMIDLVKFGESTIPIVAMNKKDASESPLIYQGNGTASGIELLLRKRNGWVTGWLSYQKNKTEYTFPSLNEGKPFLEDHDKSQEFKSVLMTHLGQWEITGNWVWATGRVYTVPENVFVVNRKIVIPSNQNNARVEPIHHLDISVSRSWVIYTAKIHFGLSVYNLYNRKNISHKKYNPYTPELTATDVIMFGITPTLILKVSF
jgi:hypothetical protein